MKNTHMIIMANEDTFGYHRGPFTLGVKKGTAPIQKGMLLTFDGDSAHVKACGAKEYPFGVALRDVDATQQDMHISIQPLSCSDRSARVLIDEDIKEGNLLGLSDMGLVKKQAKDMPFVGVAIAEAKKGTLVEALTSFPQNIIK